MNGFEKKSVKPEKFGPTQQQELRALRMKQVEGKFTEEERARFIELTALEEASKKPSALSPEEHAEYLQLTREQTAGGKNWTEEKRKRVVELQKRLEGRQ